MAVARWGRLRREIPGEGATEGRAAIAGHTTPTDSSLLEAVAPMEAEALMEGAGQEEAADPSAAAGPTGAAAADLGECA